MRQLVGHDLEDHGVADIDRRLARIANRSHEMLADDREPVSGEEPLGVVLVDRDARAPAEQARDTVTARRVSAARRPRRRRPARELIDRPEALPRTADGRDAVLGQEAHLLAAHHAGSHVHLVEGLAAPRGGSREQAGVAERAVGASHRCVVEAVAAERDGVDGRRIQRRERVRQVRLEVAVSPGVERVAVARHGADHALDLRATIGRQRWKLEPGGGGHVEDQLRQTARGGDDGEPTAGGPARALADGDRFGQLV